MIRRALESRLVAWCGHYVRQWCGRCGLGLCGHCPCPCRENDR